jgi:hemoglobin
VPRIISGVTGPTQTFYDRVGGESWFVALIDRFYKLVECDPVLRPLYPDDLAEPRRHLAAFLVQRFGGPGTYTETRGHPRLRRRHAPFGISVIERDAWMNHMAEALRGGDLTPTEMESMVEYFAEAATMLINR